MFFSYGVIEWGNDTYIGFNSDNTSYMLPGALTSATLYIGNSSNVGVQGLYVFRVDQESIIHPSQEICQGNNLKIIRGHLQTKVNMTLRDRF